MQKTDYQKGMDAARDELASLLADAFKKRFIKPDMSREQARDIIIEKVLGPAALPQFGDPLGTSLSAFGLDPIGDLPHLLAFFLGSAIVGAYPVEGRFAVANECSELIKDVIERAKEAPPIERGSDPKSPWGAYSYATEDVVPGIAVIAQ